MGLRLPELLLIFAALLLLFGATKLPALGSALGSAIRNFKKGFGGEEDPKLNAPVRTAGTVEDSRASQKVASKE